MKYDKLEKALNDLRRVDRQFHLTREKVADDNSHGTRMIARWLRRELPPRTTLRDIGLGGLIEFYALDLDLSDEEAPTPAEVFTALIYAKYPYRVSREGNVSVGFSMDDYERLTYNCFGMFNGAVVSSLPVEKISRERWGYKRIELGAGVAR
jgi:hypothetical protein